MSIVGTLKFIMNHPLNREHKFAAVISFVRWQIGIRLVPGPVVVPFVNDSRLVVSSGMTGATQNVYTGLHEFEDMSLLLHALRPADTFVDVGANVGAYTVLAGGAIGCSCVSIEPSSTAFADLKVNIRMNDMEERCRAENVAVGSVPGCVRFTKTLDTMNHVVSASEKIGNEHIVKVPTLRLDDILGNTSPTLIKIDVEGYEKEVIAGAEKALANPALLAVIMEVNSSGRRYGYDDSVLHYEMSKYDFLPFRYSPRKRSLAELRNDDARTGNNVVYIRDSGTILERVKTAPAFSVKCARL